MMGGRALEVRDDFSFETTTEPGAILFRAGPMDGGWMLKAVRHNGIDVTDDGLEPAPGQTVDGIEIELTTRTQELSGLVLDSSSRPVREYTVIVFSRSPELWTGPSRYVGTARADQDGRYKIRTLPPGDYYAAALEYLDQTRVGDPEYFESLIAETVPLTLGEGEVKSLDLRLRPGPQ
jgi:hypothetical protein